MSVYIGYYVLPASARHPKVSKLNPLANIFLPRSRLNPVAADFIPKKYLEIDDIVDGEWVEIPGYNKAFTEILTILEEGNRQTQSQICKFGDDDGPESIESIAQFLAGFISYFHLLPHDQNFISHVFQRIKSYEKTQKTIIALKPLDLKIYGMLELAEIEDVRNFAGHLRGLYTEDDFCRGGLAAGTKKVAWTDTVDVEGIAHGNGGYGGVDRGARGSRGSKGYHKGYYKGAVRVRGRRRGHNRGHDNHGGGQYSDSGYGNSGPPGGYGYVETIAPGYGSSVPSGGYGYVDTIGHGYAASIGHGDQYVYGTYH